MLKNKRFDKGLGDRYDDLGKRLAEDILRAITGAKLLTDNIQETAGTFTDGFWDQLYELPSGKRILVEPEMKDHKWWGMDWTPDRPFKYTDMDIPFRKQKNQAHLHLVISTGENYAFLLTRKAMNEFLETSGGKPKIKKTIYEPEGAPYFSTPVDRGYFVTKTQNNWHFWRKPKS